MTNSVNILALETSSPVLSVAVRREGGEIREKCLQGFLQHAENLLPLIDELLKSDGLTTADLGAILIGRGPGSFTGLRIGYATLKALLVRRKIPCFGALSLDLIAWNKFPKEGERLAVCLDAHRGEFYTRLYPGFAPSLVEPGIKFSAERAQADR